MSDDDDFFLNCTAPLTDEEWEDEDEIIRVLAITKDEITALTGKEPDPTEWRNNRARLLVHLALYRIAKFKTQEGKGYRRY
jgi:hypothetical protein